jgi:hypothetical protein
MRDEDVNAILNWRVWNSCRSRFENACGRTGCAAMSQAFGILAAFESVTPLVAIADIYH